MDAAKPELSPVAPGYRHVLRVRLAIFWLSLAAVSSVVSYAIADIAPAARLLPLAILLAGALVVAIVPERIYRRLRYGLSERLLQVVRGWLFHIDTVVPLVRVQHLDVVRGPFDKMFGTASLVVHTAGTHNSTVTLPGLTPGRATEMRDIIREHVRTDFA